ncbi:MAG TPA: M56 family metallopeptidase, partial [Candidatus Angelobacter sp.]|nr:M56 family metallopeptidase [Candidatus Angelobacter sp.]
MNASSLFALIIDSTLKATALLALAWCIGRALRNRSSASRHLVRTCALCAALLLPLLSSLLPAWHVKGIPQLGPATTLKAAPEAHPAPSVLPVQRRTRTEVATINRTQHTREKIVTPAVRGTHSQEPQTFAAASQVRSEPSGSGKFSVNWSLAVLILWMAGALAVALRSFINRLRLALLVRKAAPLQLMTWTAETQRIAGDLGIRRNVVLLESTETEVPLTTGALRPKIILPADHSEWSPLRRSAVLRHEMAHIKRLDILTQTIADCALVLYWFHPLVWITSLAMRAERERACDDRVLAAGTKPSEYAHELLEIASSLRQPALGAALAMARRSQLEGRLMAVLNPALRRGSVSRKVGLGIVALTLCIVFPLAAIQAAQQSKPSPAIRAQASTPGSASSSDQHASTRV